uniref:Uncharacterized protein n=1 Tax=Yangshan Harbor Nitrososphaeria virus TaxID=2969597 RepID=A0A976YF85_9CAUD|nr:hypothetical protein [Yangshan Harbor Nitrososphaeria virus]
MLSPKEKALVVVAYYKGAAENEIARGADETVSKKASAQCGEKILEELGLNINFVEDFEDFMKELDVITCILTKEQDSETVFQNSNKKPIFCRICQVEYFDMCTKHGNIPDSWEVRE